MLGAVAFVPAQDVDDTMITLRNIFEGSDYNMQLERLIDYFEDNYVGRYQANGNRRNPRYAKEIWNVHQLVVDDEPRTNNGIISNNRY